MRMTALVLCVLAFAAPSHAAQKPRATAQDVASMEKKCRAMVGREMPEATDGRSHEGQLNVQRFSDCMMGAPGFVRDGLSYYSKEFPVSGIAAASIVLRQLLQFSSAFRRAVADRPA
jgi:hypothetical protein